MSTLGTPCVEFDVETTGLQWYAGEPFMAQFLHADEPEAKLDNVEVFDLRNERDRDLTQRWFDDIADRGVGIRAHNAKFDLHFARSAGFNLPPDHLWHDSELLVKLCDERVTAALKPTHDRVFRGEGSDLQGQVHGWLQGEKKRRAKEAKENGTELVHPNFEDVNIAEPELMHDYGASDCVLQRGISEHYTKIIERDPKLVDLYDLERDTMVALFWAEDRGVPIDRSALAAYEAHLLDQNEVLDQRCKSLAGIDTFNPGSPKQIVEALERRRIDTKRLDATKGGGRSTDNENLQGIIHDELAETILEWRSAAKMLSTYATPALHETMTPQGPRAPFVTDENRIHADFRVWGARTGRMSCATPNLQNIPRDNLNLRYTWKAEPGFKIVTADMDQIEARLAAAFAGEGRLLDAFRTGEDIHTLTAQMVGLQDFQLPSGDVQKARDRGKKFMYQLIYGGGVKTIQKAFLTDRAGAKNMINRFHNTYPEIGRLQERISYTLADQGYIRDKYGRRHRRDDVAWDVSYRYLNYVIQGTAAGMAKEALVKAHKAGVPVIAVIHDEIVAHVPEVDAREAGVTIQEALTDFPAITEYVPLAADFDIVDRWSEAKNPDFKPPYAQG